MFLWNLWNERVREEMKTIAFAGDQAYREQSSIILSRDFILQIKWKSMFSIRDWVTNGSVILMVLAEQLDSNWVNISLTKWLSVQSGWLQDHISQQSMHAISPFLAKFVAEERPLSDSDLVGHRDLQPLFDISFSRRQVCCSGWDAGGWLNFWVLSNW